MWGAAPRPARDSRPLTPLLAVFALFFNATVQPLEGVAQTPWRSGGSVVTRDIAKKGCLLSVVTRDIAKRGCLLSVVTRDIAKRGYLLSVVTRDIAKKGYLLSVVTRDIAKKGYLLRVVTRDIAKKGCLLRVVTRDIAKGREESEVIERSPCLPTLETAQHCD